MSAETKVGDLRGSPIEIKIGGKPVTVLRMNVDTQIDVMERFVAESEKGTDLKNANDVKAIRQMKDLMVFVISKVTGIPEAEVNASAQLQEILEGFKAIWTQNEFDFLLKQVGDLTQSLETK